MPNRRDTVIAGEMANSIRNLSAVCATKAENIGLGLRSRVSRFGVCLRRITGSWLSNNRCPAARRAPHQRSTLWCTSILNAQHRLCEYLTCSMKCI